MTQPDEVLFCEGADSFRENLAAKDDLTWSAKNAKSDAPPRQWMSDLLEQRKTVLGQSGVGKLFAYVMFACFEAGVWPPGLFEFGPVFDVPGTAETITLKARMPNATCEKVLMGHFDSLCDTELFTQTSDNLKS